MKNILLINADLYKTKATDFLIEAYAEGVVESPENHHFKYLAIGDLLFNFNKQFVHSSPAVLESDLSRAWSLLEWANHVVVFCPVYASHIPSKINGFFERLFNQSDNSVHIYRHKTLEGRSARIISILDDQLFERWLEDKNFAFMSLRKQDFKRMNMNPVHTATIGYLKSLDNDYSLKWVNKLKAFGRKAI